MARLLKPLVILCLLMPVAVACSSGKGKEKEADLKTVAQEMEDLLMKNMMPVWYPRVIDKEYGGYLSNFNYKWEMTGNQTKMIVTQGRHLWMCSKMSAFSKDPVYMEYARHGFLFLRPPWAPDRARRPGPRGRPRPRRRRLRRGARPRAQAKGSGVPWITPSRRRP